MTQHRKEDCVDVEKLRDALQFMYDAFAYRLLDEERTKIARILLDARPDPAETPYPADLKHWYRDADGRVFWTNVVMSGVEPVAAPEQDFIDDNHGEG